jgi:hypothetical protein
MVCVIIRPASTVPPKITHLFYLGFLDAATFGFGFWGVLGRQAQWVPSHYHLIDFLLSEIKRKSGESSRLG